MRRGATPYTAARKAINRIAQHYPTFFGGIITVNNRGEFGAACNGMKDGFPFYIANSSGKRLLSVECTNYKVHCYKKDANC